MHIIRPTNPLTMEFDVELTPEGKSWAKELWNDIKMIDELLKSHMNMIQLIKQGV